MKWFQKSIVALFLLMACHSARERNMVEQRQMFASFVKEQYQYEVQPGDVFILIPRLICKGCVQMKLIQLEEMLASDTLEHTRIITSNPGIVSDSLEQRIVVWKDKEGWLDRVNLHIANMTMVHIGPDGNFLIRSIPTTDNQHVKVWLEMPDK
ncbi:MAG: hypothetical protein KDD36_01160 [Flavobacteriales bacterium]|nr:hypothetical protein [Flavobacteriales bacterium]